MATEGASSVNQKQGFINKCPSCGGALKAFVSSCELCGHELAGVAANRTITELVQRFNEVEAEMDRAGTQGGKRDKEVAARRARIIRDFPIPNSREDLQSLIYFIHPKIQDNVKPDPNAEDWRVKFKEVLTLAKNAYKGDAKTRAEFEEIERGLNTTLSGNLKTRAKRYPIVALGVGLVVIVAAIGLGSTQIEKWKLRQCEDKYAQGASNERARLDGIVAIAQTKLGERNFVDALASLSQLRWEYQEACKLDEVRQEQSRWEAKRTELTALIQNSESAELAQKNDAANRELAEKKEQSERELAQKKEQAERELTQKLTEKIKKASAEKKAATNKEW